MNKELLQIYKLYNIENFYYCQKIKLNLQLIKDLLDNIKNKLKSIKYINILEIDIISDIQHYIINKTLIDYNINKIKTQKNIKYLNNVEIENLNTEYFFKTSINYQSILYLRIIENISNDFHFIFILDPINNNPIGIRKNNNSNSNNVTLFQFQFFAKKLEQCINNKLKIMLHEHEKIGLFINTTLVTFPIVFFVYEARNHILSNIKNISNDKYAIEMTNYVKKKGYQVNVFRQNNQFIMGIIQ